MFLDIVLGRRGHSHLHPNSRCTNMRVLVSCPSPKGASSHPEPEPPLHDIPDHHWTTEQFVGQEGDWH
jgi:hypothetical protein